MNKFCDYALLWIPEAHVHCKIAIAKAAQFDITSPSVGRVEAVEVILHDKANIADMRDFSVPKEAEDGCGQNANDEQ
jgi:hypothetical protein